MDIASLGFRQLAGAVLRHQGWLKATTFCPEVQGKILDMPFDGESLFGKHIDDALQAIKTDTDTAKALGALQYRKTPFRGARGRGNYSFRGGYNRYQPQTYTSYRQSYQQQQQYQAPPQATYSRQPRKKQSQPRDTGRKQ